MKIFHVKHWSLVDDDITLSYNANTDKYEGFDSEKGVRYYFNLKENKKKSRNSRKHFPLREPEKYCEGKFYLLDGAVLEIHVLFFNSDKKSTFYKCKNGDIFAFILVNRIKNSTQSVKNGKIIYHEQPESKIVAKQDNIAEKSVQTDVVRTLQSSEIASISNAKDTPKTVYPIYNCSDAYTEYLRLGKHFLCEQLFDYGTKMWYDKFLRKYVGFDRYRGLKCYFDLKEKDSSTTSSYNTPFNTPRKYCKGTFYSLSKELTEIRIYFYYKPKENHWYIPEGSGKCLIEP